MSIRLYMDVHVRRAVTEGLRLHGVDVLTAQEDGTSEYSDSQLLDWSTALERVLFTKDDDLLREARSRQESGVAFTSLIYAHQLNITVGQCIADLELIANATDSAEWINQTVFAFVAQRL